MFALAGVGAFFMGLKMENAPLIFVSIFARLTAVAANASVWVITPELYTTELRATGHSVANCFARIGAFLSPYLVENRSIRHVVIGLVLALMNFVGVCAALCLPETLGIQAFALLSFDVITCIISFFALFVGKDMDTVRQLSPSIVILLII